MRRDGVRSVRSEGRELLLGERGLADEDVDEEDPALVVRVPLALDEDEIGERLRLVRDDQIAVGGREPADPDDDGEQQRAGGDEATRLQSSPRVRPPSTAIVAPVTYAAWSDARKQTTSPISLGVPNRRSGIAARSASLGPSG